MRKRSHFFLYVRMYVRKFCEIIIIIIIFEKLNYGTPQKTIYGGLGPSEPEVNRRPAIFKVN